MVAESLPYVYYVKSYSKKKNRTFSSIFAILAIFDTWRLDHCPNVKALTHFRQSYKWAIILFFCTALAILVLMSEVVMYIF